MLLKCQQCECDKNLEYFHFRKDTGKYRPICKFCWSDNNKARYHSDINKGRELNRNSYQRTSKKRKAYQKQYRENPDNKGKIRAWKSNYKYDKLQRTPRWLTEADKQEIQRIYQLAEQWTRETGIEYQVDHIEPLRGKDRSGLHVPSNLQVISKETNLLKSNRTDIFVIPADVVSMLGDGNTQAGADILQHMVDAIRQQKTGSKQQAGPVAEGLQNLLNPKG